MQEHIYNERLSQTSQQYAQENDSYAAISETRNGSTSFTSFDSPQQYEQARSYQDGYGRPSFDSMPASQPQQIYYVPVYPGSFRGHEQGLDGKILAAISYLGFWFTGLMLILFVRENRFIRFHALQSLLFFSGIMLLYLIAPFAFAAFWHISDIFVLIALLGFLVVTAVATVGWFVGLVGALSGKYYKLPLAGDLAELWIKPHEKATVKP